MDINEDYDLYEIHRLEKNKRQERFYKGRQKEQKLYNALTHSSVYRPSIYVLCEDVDFITYERVYRSYISYSKNNDFKQSLKKQATRKIRHLAYNKMPLKGNQYRKYFDIWWNIF